MLGTRPRSIGFALSGFIGLLLWPTTASANPIVPPIAIIWPVAWLALVPVIFIEAAIARHVLGFSFGRAFRLASVANLLSTLVGVPVGTCLNPLPLLGYAGSWWFLPAIVLPLYGVSVASEAFVADKFMELYVSRRPVWRWALIANAVSYLLILATLVILELNWRWRFASPV
jgi:hypothetical protein